MSDSLQFTLELQAPAPPAAVAVSAVPLPLLTPTARKLSLTFSGTGAEYFRIWIVNLLLTIVTCGLYSAWAKVRRLQYFSRNTELDGVPFDFHGNPVAILKGRLVAFVLLAGYHFAFGLSMTVGLAIFGALVLILPWLLRGALRFRMANTSWRGLRFGFTGTVTGAYAVFVPPILMFLVPGVLGALVTHHGPHALNGWFSVIGLLYLAWPSLHAAIKRYQHAHIRYGGADSQYTLGASSFWPTYVLVFCAVVVVGLVVIVTVPMAFRLLGRGAASAIAVLLGIGLYLAMLALLPLVQARLGNLVWSHTAFPGMTMTADMTFRGLFRLHMTNVLMTLVTAGLFHPFAMVRVQRYMLVHVHLATTADLDNLSGDAPQRRVNAAGEGAADFLGVDFAL